MSKIRTRQKNLVVSIKAKLKADGIDPLDHKAVMPCLGGCVAPTALVKAWETPPPILEVVDFYLLPQVASLLDVSVEVVKELVHGDKLRATTLHAMALDQIQSLGLQGDERKLAVEEINSVGMDTKAVKAVDFEEFVSSRAGDYEQSLKVL